MNQQQNVLRVKDDRKFKVDFDAEEAGQLQFCAGSLSVRISQRVRRDGVEEMWDSVLVMCKEREDGSLAVLVFVCDPNREQPLQIASIQSRPQNGARGAPILEIDMDHHEA
jgi:hypothetical protein